MLPCSIRGTGDLTLIFMPFLGGSQLEWTETLDILSEHHRCITVDLPGFGDAAAIPGYSVAEMADSVAELLTTLELGRYVLVGHSMAGKVSAVVTRRLITDGSKVHPPIALVLVAPSPPSPEPMSDSKRTQMLESLGQSTDDDLKSAETYIRDNIACTVSESVFDRTVHEVLRMNRAAWVAWLEGGSKEDWSVEVGMIDLPTLIIAAQKDSALGPKAQVELTEPHFPRGHMVEIACGHLVPIDQPQEAAALISNFLKVL